MTNLPVAFIKNFVSLSIQPFNTGLATFSIISFLASSQSISFFLSRTSSVCWLANITVVTLLGFPS